MAKLDSIIRFTGKLGNIIAYSRGGQHYLRTRPDAVRQTEGTRQAAKWFGAASRKGALMRSAIIPNLDIHCDGNIVNQLNSPIVQAGRNNHAGLTGFRFNPSTGIEVFFPQQPTFSQNGNLHIPAQELQTHGGTTRLEVKLIATRIDFANRRVTGSDATVLYIDPNKPFEGADIHVEVPGKGTMLVTLQIRSFLEDGVSCSRKMKAAEILAVVEERRPEATCTKTQAPVSNYQPQPGCTHKTAPNTNCQAIIQRE